MLKDVTITVKAGQTIDVDAAHLDAAVRLGAVAVLDEKEPKKKSTRKGAAK